jgi:hypothetical protein
MQLSPKMMSSIGADVGTALMLLGNPSVSVDEMVAEERAKVVKLRLPKK